MTNPDLDKITEIQLKAQKQKPHTRVEELRDALRDLETRIAKLSEITAESALEIPSLFDQVDRAMDELEERGTNLASELGQFDTLSAQFNKKRAQFIRHIGGPQVLAEARKARQPSQDRPWWYADQTLAAENRLRATRWLRNFAILAVVLIIAALVYDRFFAPDPAVRASYGFQQQSENALMEGNLEEALTKVQEAIDLTPDNPNLYILLGVIQETIEQPEDARKSFDTALQKFDQKDLFYNQRTVLYLMMGDTARAMADSETAIQINPDSAISYLHQGQIYETLGDIPMAIQSYETADQIAEQTGNAQLQAIIRVSLSSAYQHVTIPTLSETEPSEGE